MLVARWRDASGHGLEHCVVHVADDGVVVESVIVGGEESFGLRYRIACDSAWRVRARDVEPVGDIRSVHLLGDGAGTWWSAGAPAPQLAGAIDVDITATPFTNTLPIRRLRLDDGQSAEIVVAYVSVPAMTVTAAPQRYTRVSARRYRFESLDSDFTRELDVDEHGLVVHYPDLFERETTGRGFGRTPPGVLPS